MFMTGFHTLWTRPTDGAVNFPEYELLTLVASALAWKKFNGPMHLYTDVKGAQYINDQGLGELYDKIHLDLEQVPKDINASVFWAGGKLFAYLAATSPAVSLDLDTIVWEKLPPLTKDIVALHHDELDWPCYANNKKEFHELGFESTNWDWTVNPLNTGFLFFKNTRTKQLYCRISIAFMRRHSALFGGKPTKTSQYLDPMVFTEQRLLPMCAKLTGESVGVLGTLSPSFHLTENSTLSHIWNSKTVYNEHPVVRKPFVDYLRLWIAENFPAGGELLKGLTFDRKGIIHSSYSSNKNFRKLLTVDRGALIKDANVPAFRPAHVGSVLYFGETVSQGHYQTD